MRMYCFSLKKMFVPVLGLCGLALAVCLSFGIAAPTVRFLSERVRSSVSAVTMAKSNRNVIILDAGHGGEDSGAIASDGTKEKDLTLAFAKEIGSLLDKCGYAVVYTRDDDRLLCTEEDRKNGLMKINDLKNRCRVAEEYPGATMISLHMNSYGAASCNGLQVWFSDSEESRKLAEAIQNEVREKVQTGNTRRIKEGKDIYILEHASVNTVLVECGFLTNPEECRNLSDEGYRAKLSQAIVDGIVRNFGDGKTE